VNASRTELSLLAVSDVGRLEESVDRRGSETFRASLKFAVFARKIARDRVINVVTANTDYCAALATVCITNLCSIVPQRCSRSALVDNKMI
jgi:hypothetical protein